MQHSSSWQLGHCSSWAKQQYSVLPPARLCGWRALFHTNILGIKQVIATVALPSTLLAVSWHNSARIPGAGTQEGFPRSSLQEVHKVIRAAVLQLVTSGEMEKFANH